MSRIRSKLHLQAARVLGAMALGFAAINVISAASTSDPTGEWMVEKNLARVRVVNCSGRIWGVIAWELSPGIDSNNPDPNKRSRPTLGMPILLDMAPSKAATWEGKIYNAKDGHTYSASINLTAPDTLRVEGCFLRVMCGGQTWTRTRPPEAPTKSLSGSSNSRATHVQASDAEICSRVVDPAGAAH